ncbi:hypothetical protein GCM10027416_26650 [Okibacterium endophyticum]
MLVTTPARTLADVARTASFRVAVVMLDFALSPGRAHDAQRVTKQQVLQELGPVPDASGVVRARAVIEFADGRSGSVGESISRIVIDEIGFPEPDLQVRHPSPAGSYFETDFEWPRYRHIGEFDGAAKYLKEEYLHGRTPGEVVRAEKRREDSLRSAGSTVTRWGIEELRNPVELRDMLLDAGLPLVRRPRRRR